MTTKMKSHFNGAPTNSSANMVSHGKSVCKLIEKKEEENQATLRPSTNLRHCGNNTADLQQNLLITEVHNDDLNTAAATTFSALKEQRSKFLFSPASKTHRKYKLNRNSVKKISHQIIIIFTKFLNYLNRTSWRCKTLKFGLVPSLGATSFFTLLTLVCLETILLSTVSNCAKTFYMHWNTSNSIFRIDNTDHIIDVNKGNLAFEFDQVHIICPVYEPGTFENETEKYIIYNVSKVEYETCRITNADPRVIAICDKPQKLMFFTITFRPFTPQPGGLEFLPGNDYYFISTSSKDDLYRRIGGRCSTNNMKVVFKVCCAAEDKSKNTSSIQNVSSGLNNIGKNISNISSDSDVMNTDINSASNMNTPHLNSLNTIGMGVNNVQIPAGVLNANNGNINGINLKPLNPTTSSINSNLDQFNRIPLQENGINVVGNNFGVSHGSNGIILTPSRNGINLIPNINGGGILQFPGHLPGQTGIRINNVASQHYPSHKTNNNDDHYGKHPNEVVKNEELTYNSAAPSLHQFFVWRLFNGKLKTVKIKNIKMRQVLTNYLSSVSNKALFYTQIFNSYDDKNYILNTIFMLLQLIILRAIFCCFWKSFVFSLSKVAECVYYPQDVQVKLYKNIGNESYMR